MSKNNIVKINEYEEFRNQVAQVKEACNFIPEVSTDDGYNKSKRVALDVGKILTAVEKTRKELKSESIAIGKAIDSEAKGIVAELEVFMLPHKNAYKELDNMKKERENLRKDGLSYRVTAISELPLAMSDSDSSGVKAALEQLQANECLDFYEYTQEALKARNSSIKALGDMYATKLNAEKEAAELVELRKKQAEQERKDREDLIAKQAAEKAENEARESKASFQRAIEQASEAVKQRKAAELRAVEAEKEAAKNAEIAAENAKQEQIEAQNAEKEAERLELEKREANKKHVGAIRKAAKESLMAIGLDEETAKKVVLAINAGDIENVSIKY